MTYANVMATLALFVALGGTSVAAVQIASIKPRSISSLQIGRQAVRNVNLGTNAVSKRNLAAGSVTSQNVLDGTLLPQDFRGGQGPTGPAGPQGPAGGQSKLQFDSVAGTFAPPGQNYVAGGGPQLTVDVPASGLVDVSVQADLADGAGIALYIDGSPAPGQDNQFCGNNAGDGGLISADISPAITVSTPAALISFGCGVIGPPGSVLIRASPGSHLFELYYSDCGCGGPSPEASNRKLWIAPRP